MIIITFFLVCLIYLSLPQSYQNLLNDFPTISLKKSEDNYVFDRFIPNQLSKMTLKYHYYNIYKNPF